MYTIVIYIYIVKLIYWQLLFVGVDAGFIVFLECWLTLHIYTAVLVRLWLCKHLALYTILNKSIFSYNK